MAQYLRITPAYGMDMPYTQNPHLPRLRMEAVLLVRKGWGIRQVARHTGFQPSTISRWVKRAPENGNSYLPTRSPRPVSHPRSLDQKTIQAIVEMRLKHRRCAEVLQHLLRQENIVVSLRTIKRVLQRKGLTKKRSKWKKIHRSPHRPNVASAGDLIQLDTIHIHTFDGRRFYIYTLLDVHSRWAYAKVSTKITAGRTLKFLDEAKHRAPFRFKMLQSDHGPEFAKEEHCYSRVRRPNDNAHLE